ncbi:MAG TPA: hypothetical protein VGD74_09765 [Vulgatibacter sp.]
MARRDGTWAGGYIRRDAQGRKLHVIRRSIGGQRYEISTGCTTERAAMRELEKFESDPPGYRPGGDPGGAIHLDGKLVAEFLEDHAANSERWQAQQRLLLAWWGEKLRGVDLRRATLAGHILPALRGQKWVPKKQVMIKRLFAWLRESDQITAAEDPTLKKLKVAQSKPAQLASSKVIPAVHYEKARLHLVGHYRDAIDLLAGTGWHVSEAQRFASEGVIDERDGETVLMVRHKSGAPHRTLVSEEVAEAAKRLRARGTLSDSQLHKALAAACKAAGVPPFKAGWFRHTIATIATEAGQEALVPGFLGHRSASTTRRFYAVRVTPPKVPTLR